MLRPGDKVATISLSWGGAGELRHRYTIGKKQLEENFGLEVIETKNALKSADYLYRNPEARADDFMEAFSHPDIKAILTNIGGEDSIRTLPFMNLSLIRKNPKIFLGFSDSTISHFVCYKAGLTSFYGTSLLIGFAENGGMHEYQVQDLKQTLFSANPRNRILPNREGWTSERLEWNDLTLQDRKRKLQEPGPWNFLNGKGVVQGKLLGGCLEVLNWLNGTDYWPDLQDWEDKILFFETSEEKPDPKYVKYSLRNLAAQGILQNLKGILVGRPYDNQFVKEYNEAIIQVIREEEGLRDLPIITEMDFGHTCPVFTLPLGILAEIDLGNKSFSLLEPGVQA